MKLIVFPISSTEIDVSVISKFALEIGQIVKQSPPANSTIQFILFIPSVRIELPLLRKDSKGYYKKSQTLKVFKAINRETWESSSEKEQQTIIEVLMLDVLSKVPVTVMDEEDRARLKMQIRSIYNRTSADDQT